MTSKQETLIVLGRLSMKFPNLRVMQLISNCIPTDVLDRLNHDLYYVEDEALMEYLLAYETDTLDKGEI